MKPQIDTDKHGFLTKNLNRRFGKILFLSVFICVNLWLMFLVSCSSPPTDLRAFVPADTLVYLETGDLARTLDALTENKAFESLAKNKPDFSALGNVQLAVAVTGFETSEQQITSDNAVLNFKPRFVAVAETHAWNWQTVKFTENKLGEFVNDVYGGEVSLETTDKNGGKSFVWTAADGRKIYAFVEKSRVFFGNDESAIEKCLSAARGEIDSLAKSGKAPAAVKDALAAGYVSGEGVAQIANVAGVSAAIEAAEEDESRSFIARVLPQLVRGSIKEIVWTAIKTTNGIEDRYAVTIAPEVAAILRETLVTAKSSAASDAAVFVPLETASATRYDLQNPQLAWRSLLLVAAKQTDVVTGKILAEFSGGLLDSYGVTDAETFLSAVDSPIWTAQMDAEGEKTAVIVAVKNADLLKKSIAEVNFKAAPEKRVSAEFWKSEDGETAAAFAQNKLILGDSESVFKCLEAAENGRNLTAHALYKTFSESKSVAATFGKSADSAEKIVRILTETKTGSSPIVTNFITETRLTDKVFERRTVSPFGLIGAILEQLEK
jgi:hypothetical protein